MADEGWQREFDEPIDTLDGKQLSTLRAVAYLARPLPKAERDTPAAEMLTYAAERGLAWMFLTRIAVLKALHRPGVRRFNPDAREHHWGSGSSNATNDGKEVATHPPACSLRGWMVGNGNAQVN